MQARWIAFYASSAMVLAQGVWERRADYPVQATEVSAAAIGGKVYAVCGLTAQGSINSLFIYDPFVDTWSQGASLPISGGADHCNVAAAAGKLYVLGAIRIGTSFVDGNTYEYDPAVDRWQMVARMPTPRGASGVATIGSRIYVAGGLDPGRSVAAFEVFDTTSRQWTQLPAMPTARDHLTAQAINEKFYAISGRAGDVLAANEEYDPETNTWTARAPIPTPRGGLASGVIGNRMQVFGGEGPSGTPQGTFRQNDEYDPETDTWRSLTPMPVPRHGLYGATTGGRIFTPSGGPQAGAFFSNAHEAFFLPLNDPPISSPTGARNAASLQPALSAGALVSLFGHNFSEAEQVATRLPLPTQMNAVVVSVNGTPAPLIYVGPDQINFQLPYDVAGDRVRISVSYAGQESGTVDSFALFDSAPGVFTLSQDGQGQGEILIAGTGLLAGAIKGALSTPARKGQAVSIYCTGLGQVINPPPAGEAAPLHWLVPTVATPIVMIGGERAEVLFSGLAPTLVGVYQINARVPANSQTGDQVPVTVRMGENGRISNQATMAVLAE